MANTPSWSVVASRTLPIAMTDSWDGPAAANRMLNAANIGGDNPDYDKAYNGFLVCDTANKDLRGSYKLPFADIIDGTLKADSSGLSAAAQRLPQTDIPDSVRKSAQNVIDAYKAKMKPPSKSLQCQRAYSVFTVKNIIEDQRIIEGIATTPTADRSGDIVVPTGAQFQLPIPLLWQHDSRQPIGKIVDAIISPQGIKIRGQIAKVDEPGTLKDRLDEAWQTMKAGLVGGLSIGFKSITEERIGDSFSYKILKWLWLELSAVTIPANGEATITAIKSIDQRELAAISHKATRVVKLSLPGATGFGSSHPKPVVKDKDEYDMRNISEQITALESTRAAKSAQMEAVMSRSIEEGRSTDASEREEFDTLEQDIEALDGDLKRLRSLEKSAAFAAREVKDVRNIDDGSNARSTTAGVQIKRERPKLEKGCEFAQFAICLAAGRGNLLQSFEIAKSRYADNEDLVGIMKNAVTAGTTTDANWAGNLVIPYQRFTGDFVEFLRPQTILGKFGVGGIPALRRIPFNVAIVGQSSGGQGYWVGDGAPKPLTKFDFTLTNLRWAKVANIAVITEELLRFSQPSADVLVRDALAQALIQRLDIDFVDPNKAAVTNVSPASITYGVVALTSAGNSAQDVRTDVAAVLGQYIAANITPTTAVWIMSARRALSLSLMRNALGQREFPDITMMGGMLEGIPVITSEYQHSDSDGDNVVLVNASDVWLADDGQVMLDASRETSLQMDDSPTENSATGTGTSMVSMFQTNSIALRAERWINWQKRRPNAVVVLNAVNWGLDSGT
jgi:HK97 family phage major capsid protein/HK97 family phage prohead protease